MQLVEYQNPAKITSSIACTITNGTITFAYSIRSNG